MPIRGEGTREEDEGEDAEDREEGEETAVEETVAEETVEETAAERIEKRGSPASTAEERATRLPLVQARRSLEGMDERTGTGTVEEGNGRPLL